MNTATEQLALAVIDTLRGGLPAGSRWPQGEALEVLKQQAIALVEAAGGHGDREPATHASMDMREPQEPPQNEAHEALDPAPTAACAEGEQPSEPHDPAMGSAGQDTEGAIEVTHEAQTQVTAPETASATASATEPGTDATNPPPGQAGANNTQEHGSVEGHQARGPDSVATAQQALRPGQIPQAQMERVAVEPIRLVVDIASNAREGEPYESPITVRTAHGQPAAIVACDIPEASGVVFSDGVLRADNPRAGEYPVRLTCSLEGAVKASGLSAEASLVVNHDPRTLWQNIASDRDAPGWKQDSAHTALSAAGGRRIAIASERGRSHAHRGGFRDDDYGVRVSAPDGWNLVAVADGAGSAERSRIGSRVAAETAVGVLAQKLGEGAGSTLLQACEDPGADPSKLPTVAYGMLAPAAFEAVKAIEAKAKSQGLEPRDYATTLLLAAHHKLADQELVAAYWIGDGAIALFDQAGSVDLLGWPDGGEYAGQTRFLDRAMVTDGGELLRRIAVRVVPSFDALILMTDGVSDPWFPSDRQLKDHAAWASLWAQIAPLLEEPNAGERLIEWLGFWSAGNHDDRTLAVLW